MKTHSSAGFFVFRTPTLPWETVEGWAAGLRDKESLVADCDISEALAADEALLRARLRELVTRPSIREAIFIASPSLEARLANWLAGETSESAHSVEPVLVRYLMRMSGRCTPFGLFAATGVGAIGRATQLTVPPRDDCARHTRLDMDYVFRLTQAISANPQVRAHLRFTANHSEYDINGRLRYVETRAGTNLRTYHLVDVARTPYLEIALAACRRSGGATIEEVSGAIVRAFPAVRPEAATEYVLELISTHLLCSPLIPVVTGSEPVVTLTRAMEGIEPAAKLFQTLGSVLAELAALDASGFGASPQTYMDIAEGMRSLPAECDLARLFQIDLHWTGSEATLSQPVVDEIGRGVELLHSMAGVSDGSFQVFARAFEARYEGREVPLLEALDEEAGVGFEAPPAGTDAAPILDGIPLFGKVQPNTLWRSRERLLLRKLQLAAMTGAIEVVLTDEDVEVLTKEKPRPLAPGVAAIVSIDAASPAAVDRGEYRLFLSSASGPTAGLLFGRFCHGDPDLAARTRQALSVEDASEPEAVHAELAHLPQGRVGNIICRPLLREYEVPIVGGSGAPFEQQIQLNDLLLSYRDGRFQLRSRRLGRRVVVHLSSAHNTYEGGLAVYRFLARLYEHQYAGGLGWSWGPLDSAPFLPRVVRGRYVLSRAQWALEGDQLKPVIKANGVLRWRLLQELRTSLRLPRFVRLADGDNTLPVDLENVLSVESLLSVLSNRARVVLTETFPSNDGLVAAGAAGRFHHEIVVPFVANAPSTKEASAVVHEAPPPTATILSTAPSSQVSPSSSHGPRRLGDDWLYLKVYGGVGAIDRILLDNVEPLVRQLRAERLISRWFFIRYSDPEWHLRMRFKGEPATLLREVTPRVLSALDKSRGMSHKLAADTYVPEVDRYGGEIAMPHVEQVFEADSDAALEVLAACRADRNARWRLCLLGMKTLLSDLQLPPEIVQAAMVFARDGQLARYQEHVLTKKAMGNKYRGLQKEVAELLERTPDRYSAAVTALGRRSASVAEPFARLRQMEKSGNLTRPCAEIALSFLHMWANRLCRGSANAQELVLYDILGRYSESQLARARRGSPATKAASSVAAAG